MTRVTLHNTAWLFFHHFSDCFLCIAFPPKLVQKWSENWSKIYLKSILIAPLVYISRKYDFGWPYCGKPTFLDPLSDLFSFKIHQRINEESDRIYGLPKIDFLWILEPFLGGQGGPTNWLVFQDRPFCSRVPHQIDSWTSLSHIVCMRCTTSVQSRFCEDALSRITVFAFQPFF